MKKIVFSANTSWYLYNFRYSSIKAFIDKGYQVYCISPEDDYSDKLISELSCKWFDIKIDNKGSNPLVDLITCYNLYKLFNEINPDYLFNFTIKNNIYGTWAARLNNSYVINNVSGLGTAFILDNLTSKLVKILYKLSQPLAKKVFCQNPEDFELLLEHNLVPKNKLELLPGSGVNTKKFNPIYKKSKNDIFEFLYVGRMLADKGLYELIEAAKELNAKGVNFKLKLCGLVDNRNASAISLVTINQWAEYSFVEWLGSSDDMVSVYADVDCVILPSYREGMPRTLLEAGAMGLPSIATNVAGCKHIVDDGYNGFLCEVKDSQSLCKVMEKIILLSDEEYDFLCSNSRFKVEHDFDEAIVIRKTLSTIDF